MSLCLNSNCKHVLERPRKGWRRRSGEFADLCDPCASAYEEGIFCETFHINSSGWRCCESCGKQIHCGCIVSFHTFVLLDAGGIECITCARKSFILTPNPAWPPPSLILPSHSERIKDVSSKNWCHIAGSGPVPWRQAPGFFNSLNAQPAQPNLRPSMPMEIDLTGGVHRLTSSERLSVDSFDKKRAEVLEGIFNGSVKLVESEKLDNGINCAEQAKLHVNVPQQPPFLKKERLTPYVFSPFSSVIKNEINDSEVVSNTHVPQPINPYLNGKQCSGQCETESHGKIQICNRKPSSLRRYWPRTSNHELQQISGTSNSQITPLFEKTLSVSDVGSSGRLVLPKKCAETYLPSITEAGGLPLNIQDLKGKEWTFNFRCWPNNNSRMYVLEGVNPCFHSMNLQAGDVVTFNRIESEGKLVIGFRKTLNASTSNQDAGTVNANNGSSTDGDDSSKKSKDQASSFFKNKKDEYKVKKVLGNKDTVSNKRKKNTLGSKNKLKNEKNDILEMELTWEQAQVLLRPPLNRIPRVTVIEGFEVEEFEDAPVIGRPTIFPMDNMGENIQWVQCEDCVKWRKVPADALLSSRWTCSGNSWDPERSSCSAAQELTGEQLKELLPHCNHGALKQEPDSFIHLDDEEDANPSSSQATKKHPRHESGCTCIICLQPPKGIRHVETCICNVCLSLKRRLQTLLTRRENKKTEKEAESSGQKLQDYQSSVEIFSDEKKQACLNNNDDFNTTKSSLSPFKGQIDLNIQPERDEEQSPGSDSGELKKLIQETTDGYLRHSDLNGNFRNGNGSGNRNGLIISHNNFEPSTLLDSTHASTSTTKKLEKYLAARS